MVIELFWGIYSIVTGGCRIVIIRGLYGTVIVGSRIVTGCNMIVIIDYNEL